MAGEEQVQDTDLNGEASDIPFASADSSKIKIKGVDDTNDPVDEGEGADSGEGEGEGDDAGEGEGSDSGEGSGEGEGEGEGAEEGDGEESDGGEPTTMEYTEDQFRESVNNMISKVSNNTINGLADLPNLISENAALKKQLETAKEPQFASEAAKKLFEYSNKAAGFEIQAANQYLHVMSLGDVKALSDKDAQFEAFHLSRPDLTREKARNLFEKKYDETYNDLEENIVQQDNHAVATREAKEKLEKLQSEFNQGKSEAQEPEVDSKKVEEIHAGIDQIMEDFGGMVIPFGEGETEKLNLPMEAEEVSAFKDYLKNPNTLIESIIQDCMDEKGQLNYEAYAYEMYMVFKRHELAKEAHGLGKTNGELKYIQDKKNSSKKQEPAAAPSKPKKSFEQAMEDAVLGSVSARRN